MSRISLQGMADSERLTEAQVCAARHRRLEAMHLQDIEDNPLDPGQIAMFEMFEREKWPHDRRRAFITRRTQERNAHDL